MAIQHTGSYTGNGERASAWFTEFPVLLIVLYFTVQTLLRWWLGAPANLDEAEQFVLSNGFSAGYGPHPPLYQWLQTAAFAVFGVNFFAIAIVKNLLLMGAWIAVWLVAREVSGSRRIAAIAAFGLLFSPNLSWESQIDHTHTVSNTLLVALTTLQLFRLSRAPSTAGYVILGLAIGLGVMAKYNYILFLAAAFAAFATHPLGRPVVLSKGFALALLTGLAVCSPHLWYLAANPVEGTAKLSNLGMNRFGFVETRMHGFAGFARAVAGVHAIWLVLAALGWLDRRRDPRPLEPGLPQGKRDSAALMVRLWVSVAASFVVLVVAGGTTNFRDHWLQPESVFFPLVLAILFARQIDAIAFRRLALAAAVLMMAIPIAVASNKRFFPGAQRDAAMPDPAAIAAAFPQAASGEIPILIRSDDGRNGWYAAGHLRYWLQVPVPLHGASAAAASGPALLLVQSASAADAGEGAAPIPFFRPGEAAKREQPWFAKTLAGEAGR